MNDIEILEKFLDLVKEIKTIYTGDEIIPEDVPIIAIENLINRVKELEEELKEIKKEYSDEQKHEMKNTIPKSKIKEKIENYNSKGYIEASEALKKLLEE